GIMRTGEPESNPSVKTCGFAAFGPGHIHGLRLPLTKNIPLAYFYNASVPLHKGACHILYYKYTTSRPSRLRRFSRVLALKFSGDCLVLSVMGFIDADCTWFLRFIFFCLFDIFITIRFAQRIEAVAALIIFYVNDII
ncbi:MAG: hypothetical protein IJB99_05085, partial [Clostridia bacterium]|nr:hypothetical protein [Clostridia bacterium]